MLARCCRVLGRRSPGTTDRRSEYSARSACDHAKVLQEALVGGERLRRSTDTSASSLIEVTTGYDPQLLGINRPEQILRLHGASTSEGCGPDRRRLQSLG